MQEEEFLSSKSNSSNPLKDLTSYVRKIQTEYESLKAEKKEQEAKIKKLQAENSRLKKIVQEACILSKSFQSLLVGNRMD